MNRNNLVREFPFVNGVKTGFTNGAGYVLVGSGTQGWCHRGLRPDRRSVRGRARCGDPRSSCATASRSTRRRRVLEEGERLDDVAIIDRDVSVPVEASRGVVLTVRKRQDVEVQADGVPAEVEGPVKKGERLGHGHRDRRRRRGGAGAARGDPLGGRRQPDRDASTPPYRASAWGPGGCSRSGAACLLVLIVVPRGLALQAPETPPLTARPAIVSAGERLKRT